MSSDTAGYVGSGFVSGASQGAQAGAAVGPWGAAIGGAIGAVAGGVSGFLNARTARKNRRRMRRQLIASREYADQRINELTGQGTLFGRAKEFLNQTFSEGGNVDLRGAISQQMRVAQASRGLFTGNAAAAAEGQAVGMAQTQLRANLAPLASQFTFMPEQMRQSIQQSRFAGANFFASTNNAFTEIANQALQGGAGGAQMAQYFKGFGQQQQQQAPAQGQTVGIDAAAQQGMAPTAENPFLNPYGEMA